MKRYQTMGLALLAAATAAATGCGDDSSDGDSNVTCGAGTTNVDGVCTAEPAVTCSGGTVLENGTCVPSDDVCADGTVLAGAECVDPATLLDVAVEEAAEPNNLGIITDVLGDPIEPSANPAGSITLPAIDATVVVRGTINPHQDLDGIDGNDADFDTFVLTAAGPTLVEVSTDGTNGLLGAFAVSVPVDATGVDPLSGFLRYGISVVSDTAKRFVYLPAAGDYYLTVGDIRAFYVGDQPPNAGGIQGSAGGPDADYYVSLTSRALPTAETVNLVDGTATITGQIDATAAPKVYSIPMGEGVNRADLDIDGSPTGALVLLEGDEVRAVAQETADFFGPVPAATSVLGGATGTLVVDFINNYNPTPTDFVVNITAGTAAALSTTGGTAMQPEDDVEFSVFYYDVTAADEIKGFDLSFNQPVAGVVVDEDFLIAANFTFDPDAGFADTFTDYVGLIRHRGAGRYYFLTFDPEATGAASIVATSTITTVAPVAVTRGTPLTGQTVNTFNSNPFSYTAGVAQAPWQTFHVTGTGTGVRTANFFDADDAYGALDPVDSTDGGAVPDVAPNFVKTFGANSTPQGRILLDDPTERYLVTVNTANATGTLTVDFAARTIADLGTLANGQSASPTGQQLTMAAPLSYYLVRNAVNVVNNISVNPTNNLFDTRIVQLNANEQVTGSFNSLAPGPDGSDTASLINSNGAYVAFAVTNGVTLITQAEPYTITVAAVNFVPGTYTRATGTTAYVDACTLGTEVTLLDDGSGFGPADDGLSASIAAPAGFELFGFAASSFIVSSNGWITFGSPAPLAGGGVGGSSYANVDMPNATAPNGIIAPAWDDALDVTVCTRTVGTTLIVQWSGDTYQGTSTAAQAILDGSDGSIEFVYGAGQIATGATATVGIEDQAGGTANRVGFNTAGTTVPGTSYLFTPVP